MARQQRNDMQEGLSALLGSSADNYLSDPAVIDRSAKVSKQPKRQRTADIPPLPVEAVTAEAAVRKDTSDVPYILPAMSPPPTRRQEVINSNVGGASAAGIELERLMKSLSLNLDVQFTKADTARIMASLMVCNETQLNAMLGNRRTPVVVKAVIRKLIDSAERGDLDAVFKLWDRIYGREPLMQGMSPTDSGGVIPVQPISREAYILIRDRLIK